MSTSLTDTAAYREFCLQAATDPATFSTFRRHPEMQFLAVPREIGEAYLRELHEVDTLYPVGSPHLFDYSGLLLDPVMLRYCHQRQEIVRLFGSTEKMRILEIGGGFGGLARVFAGRCVSYSICDLPEARQLQNTYAALFGLVVRDGVPGGYDLIISAYAFSELTREVQVAYASDFQASRGWMVYNDINPAGATFDELIEMLPAFDVLPEHPQSHPDNRVLVWGAR